VKCCPRRATRHEFAAQAPSVAGRTAYIAPGDCEAEARPLHDVVKGIRCVNNLTRAGEKIAHQ